MPHLSWPSKTNSAPIPGSLEEIGVNFPRGIGYPEERPENKLILGDNLCIMSALLEEYEGRISLIYTDPPFFSNRSYQARIGRGEDSRKPKEWQLTEGYPDSWPDIDAYLDMLYPRLSMMHRLLAPNGTLYLHLDWHANAYARLLLDEIFGADRLLNEIVWAYHGPSPIRTAFNRKHDTILVYTKSENYTFNVDAVRQPYDPSTVKTFASSPKAGFGKIPDLERGKVPEDWWYFPVVARLHNERTGYPTQKPEALLKRILLASSNQGDLVADFFCGSGTLPVVASRIGRKFIASDLTWRAFHTTRTRLTASGSKPFRLEQEKCSANSSAAFVDCTESLMNAISLQDKVLSIDPTAIPELDYWEIDPAWDGIFFRSAAQAVRPRRKLSIPSQIELPCKPAGPVCIRLVTAAGEHYQIVLTP
ncbi:MAG: site-specific DNA-methyltransferase [Chloroflexi bacterium]|nr:MAG: site-specific DNA-methyltransferase [Chloroflexota bacterium]